jgi:small-conductance mechanosensitive channel
MGKLTVLALRAVLVVLLAGSVFVQTVMVPLLAIDLEELDAGFAHLRTPFLVIAVLGVVTVQVVLVCVWRLVTMVRRGTVFSHAAFRYVDVVIGAIVAAALLLFALAVILAPGDAVPPGMILLMCGAVVAVLGVALIVLVLRMLLAQAVARDLEAAQLQAELDEVI